MMDRRPGRSFALIAILLCLLVATHFGWELIDEWRLAKRYFYAMHGLAFLWALLCLTYIQGRVLSDVSRNLLVVTAIVGSIEEAKVFGCGAALALSNLPSPQGGRLCESVEAWTPWIIVLCLGLYGASRIWRR